ncbi:aminotransferase class IV family protein [Rhizobium sp. CFBP 8762]|uniref:aminotransferase class IV family protein n=1 Tax=Rhizobium sp. CFBP 8762 TaxID=2775279 RepID=UPI00177CA3A4|nr:aminotransferase class IV family protein [Rhizobium sp. CFBP 8762]MBD8556225.1 aminotransferase class IV family protein [Rhizobium sp. CFBP 8762]
MNDFVLIETLGWNPQTGFSCLPLHLARLFHSAQALGFPPPLTAESRLKAAVSEAKSHARLRLTLATDGTISVTVTPYIPLPNGTVWTVKLAATRLTSADPLIRHKTSRRAVYEAARAEFSTQEANEVLLCNEDGLVCEGTFTSLFARKNHGPLKTPPLANGLLAGVLRQSLLKDGKAVEQTLTIADLATHTLFVGNSLRGLIPVKINL